MTAPQHFRRREGRSRTPDASHNSTQTEATVPASPNVAATRGPGRPARVPKGVPQQRYTRRVWHSGVTHVNYMGVNTHASLFDRFIDRRRDIAEICLCMAFIYCLVFVKTYVLSSSENIEHLTGFGCDSRSAQRLGFDGRERLAVAVLA